LIHFIRQVLHPLLCGTLDQTRGPLYILPLVSKLDILNTLPGLQHEFCALWNEITQQAQNRKTHYNVFDQILLEIRHLFVALHPTDATPQNFISFTTDIHDIHQQASYHMCEMAGHLSDVISDICDANGDKTGVTTPLVSSSFSSNPPHHPSGESSSRDVPNISQSLTPGASLCHSIPPITQGIPKSSTHISTHVTQVIADNPNNSSMTKPIPLSPSISCISNERRMVSSGTFQVLMIGSDHSLLRLDLCLLPQSMLSHTRIYRQPLLQALVFPQV
jgi:hypothetical protein